METQNSIEIKNKAVMIQCTYANAFTEPVWDRGLCIRSFDRPLLSKLGSKTNIIGTLTGNYTEDSNGKTWMEANLQYTDRRPTGWFRLQDIWFDGKDGEKNTDDENQNQPETKKGGALAWITAALAALSFLR